MNISVFPRQTIDFSSCLCYNFMNAVRLWIADAAGVPGDFLGES